ncbi:MAG: SMC-Scp complex subunit ScpB [Actinomycetota bacterium]|jgi:segregation and condensation protein B|nr:SMC-Scp complex subunit ScpB [Actinomycetota bacterium]
MTEEEKKYFPSSLYDELMEGRPDIKTCIEGILFICEKPVTPNEISKLLNYEKNKIQETIDILEEEYIKSNRGFIIRKIGNGYRMYSNPALKDLLKNFVNTSQKVYITQAALETLAIIAYKQPVTRQQIAEIRGVKTDSIVISLVNKGLVKEAGRLKVQGSPIIYRTTSKFLEMLGLKKLDELPVLNIKEDQ